MLLFCFSLLSLALVACLPMAAVQIGVYFPNTWCDVDAPLDQSAFGGQELELSREIIERLGWNQSTYDMVYFCIPDDTWYITSYSNWTLENGYGLKYLMTL